MSDGIIKSIYCHWDGYPSNNGKILLEHYNSQEKDNPTTVVNKVSKKQVPEKWFNRECGSRGLGFMAKMICPWPYQRYCRTSDLVSMWEKY